MGWSRREFLGTIAGIALSGRAGPTGMATGLGAPPCLADFLGSHRGPAGDVPPTGLARRDYLRIIGGITRFFAAHQDARGAIIDPYEGAERQYSTPAFALAAAVLSTSGGDAPLLGAAVRAMEAACADLAAGRAADGHADFFTALLMHADLLLRGAASPDAVARWRRDLARVAPDRVYRQQPTGDEIANWNLVAATGERLRTREGLAASDGWVGASVARQLGHFTPLGMYRDPGDPMAYDHFARLWALDLLDAGYDGPGAASLQALVTAAAELSLFLQSPHGELPCGGRTAHHQWNEAEQAVTFETFARRWAARGEADGAGAFKRGAHLALQSIGRWVRPSGELWIVKNRVDPKARHGYEPYSFHSQYNLLTAAMLALAWLVADDSIRERACPADTGLHAFALQPAFHKVLASAGGWYVEIDTGADLHYNPTGILRVHHRGFVPETLSDGATPECTYSVPSRPASALALGPEWRARDGTWHALASHGGAELGPAGVSVEGDAAGRVAVEVRYAGRLRGGATSVRETLRLSASGIDIEHTVEGDVTEVREVVPFLASDGQTDSDVAVVSGGATVGRGRGRLRISGPPGTRCTRVGSPVPGRNGFLDAVRIAGAGSTARCTLGVSWADERRE